MKSKFNYITYTALCLLLLFFLVVAFSLPKYIPLLIAKEQNLLPIFIGIVLVVIGVLYGVIVFFDLLIRYRYSIKIQTDGLLISDRLTLKRHEIAFEFIKGYYIDTYIYSWMFEAIVIETFDGQKIRVLNFFCWNFKSFTNKLRQQKIKKLRSEH